jgi:hypothetical protein
MRAPTPSAIAAMTAADARGRNAARVYTLLSRVCPPGICSCHPPFIRNPNNQHASEGFEEFDKIGLLLRREIQPKQRVVVIDDREQICRAAVMKVRRMLPDAA